jgi:mono/diheme cytochrome c family protein
MTNAVRSLFCVLVLLQPLSMRAEPEGANANAKAQGVFTRAQAIRGRDQYAAHCAACHADNLAGIGPALPLAGGTFQSKWASQSVFDFYERVRTTMPQSAPNSLDAQVYADIVAFILRANNFPTGPAELVGASPTLKQTPMTGGKP